MCVLTCHMDECAFKIVCLIFSIDMKMALFQLRASLATWRVNCHTWRRVRRNSSVWKTRPWVRPSGRGRGCLLSGEHHMHSCTVVFAYTRYIIVDFCAPRQHFRCSVRTEWPWHSGVRAYVPASWSQQPEELLYRITSPYWEVRWLWRSRQVPRSYWVFFKIMYINERHLNLCLFFSWAVHCRGGAQKKRHPLWGPKVEEQRELWGHAVSEGWDTA